MFITDITSKGLLMGVIIAALVFGIAAWLISDSVLLALIIAFFVWWLPNPVFVYLKEKRVQKFNEVFPAALDKMVSSAKAGLSLVQVFEVVAKDTEPPISEEFGLGVHDYKLGKDMTVVIEDMKKRLNSRMFDLFATAVLVNREKGGNFPEALHNMSKSFKEISRLEEKVTTASAEGRKGARVISLMPAVIFVFVSLMQPDLIETLTGNFVGWILLGISVALYVLAIFWLRKVLAIDV